MARYLPILGWLPPYDRVWLSVDIVAGLTLWGLVVPQAMAYAGIPGLPPQTGLYTLVAALLVYALISTSRHLVVQATSAMIEESETTLRAMIFDSSSWYQLDLTSTDILKKMVQELRGTGIEPYFAELHVPVLEYGRQMGLLELVGEDHVLPTVDAAVNCIENDQGMKSHPKPLLTK